MTPEEIQEISQRVLESAQASSDEESLKAGMESIIEEFSQRFPENGRAIALHEVVSFLFANNVQHFSFFPEFVQLAYDALGEISKWHAASSLAEKMIEHLIELSFNNQAEEEESGKWFTMWANSVRKWCETSVNEESWPNWGTGILNRCERFCMIISIQEDIFEFWDSLLDTYGTFAPSQETVERNRNELLDLSKRTASEPDSHHLLKAIFTTRIRLHKRLDVGDLVDLMNRCIELAPKQISAEEVEIHIREINSAKGVDEACTLAKSLAKRLRVGGDLEKAIAILNERVEALSTEVQTEAMASTHLQLAIYLDEGGYKEKAETYFQMIAELEPGTDSDSISVRTVHSACHRYASFLSTAERFTESKKYSIREHSLSELLGDPYLFVRSCFNIVADCLDLKEDDESSEWYMLGMANLRDAIYKGGPMGMLSDSLKESLLQQAYHLTARLGIEDKWPSLINHLFAEPNDVTEEQA